MKSNPVLEANLACISKYNPSLKYKIMRIEFLKNDISIVNTILQEPNFMYNGVYLHNNYGAEAEAKEIFAQVTNENSRLHVLFGFGLGYLFQEAALNSKGTVLVYEPNLEVLAAALEIADFSKELSKENVFVFNDYEEFIKMYSCSYRYNSNTDIIFLPSYKYLFSDELNKFAENLNMHMGALIMNNNYIKNRMPHAIKMLCSNIDLLVNEPQLAEYKNLYEGKSAVIVSAGPTLDRDIESLKKYRENIIILSVGQAARTLVNNGVTPDFVGLIESSSQMSQIDGLNLSDANLIIEPITYRELHFAKFKNIISYPSQTSSANLIWTEIANIDASQYVSSGTVSYMMLYAAKILGFKNIILVGQDLAYIDGKCYTKYACQIGLNYEFDVETEKAVVTVENFEKFKNSFVDKNLSDEQKNDLAMQRINFINKNLCFVAGISGNKVPSTRDYSSFIYQFRDFAGKFKNEINLYNASLLGAKIEGFDDIEIEQILKTFERIEVKNIISKPHYDIELIINNIRQELKIIEDILKMLKTSMSLVSCYDKEFHNRKFVNENCMRYFKQILAMYIDLVNIYCPKCRIFAYLHKSHSMDLEYSLRTNKDTSSQNMNKVYENLKTYITSVMSDLNEISAILKSKVVNLNEMLNTKS